jgi:hypothetical protein
VAVPIIGSGILKRLPRLLDFTLGLIMQYKIPLNLPLRRGEARDFLLFPTTLYFLPAWQKGDIRGVARNNRGSMSFRDIA